ncbi:MAG: MOSC domain-containing protein [Chitinophagaceae bacterium]|nr:MAG: MOSC domain-containing protein [Chitinophagaceae bacterium]
MKQIGKIVKSYAAPVKSMFGQDYRPVHVAEHGIVGDRVFQLYDSIAKKVFNGKKQPELARFRTIDYSKPGHDPGKMESYNIRVVTPDQKSYSIHDKAFLDYLKQRYPKHLKGVPELQFSSKGFFDLCPISLVGKQTLEQLSKELGIDINPFNFRENFYVEWSKEGPFYENELVGNAVLKMGSSDESAQINIVRKDARCRVINYDPKTDEENKDIQRQVLKNHENCVGVYATVEKPGIVIANETVFLLD